MTIHLDLIRNLFQEDEGLAVFFLSLADTRLRQVIDGLWMDYGKDELFGSVLTPCCAFY